MRASIPPPLPFLAMAIMLTTLLVLVPSQADGQTVPSYTDSSTGLPTADLWVTKLVFFDIDEDGDQDILALGPRKGDADKNLHVWKWGGSSWTEATATEGLSSIGHSSYGGFAFADFDNDDDWDIGAGSHGAADVNAYRKTGTATYIDSSIGLDTAEDAWNIEFGDFNSDGDMDLLETGFWGMDVKPFSGNGLGTWLERSTGLPDGHSRVDGFFCDFTNDGNLDIVATWGYADWVYLGDGNGTWTNSSEGLPGGSVGFGSGVGCGDFNDDGYNDIVLSVGGQTRGYAGDGTGNWTEVSTGLPAYDFSSIVLADMNNDGYDDVVGMIPSDPGVVELYLYTGANSWAKADTTTMQGNAKGYRVDVGDFDNNGFLDIAGGFGTDDMALSGSIKIWRESSTASDLDVTLLHPDGGEMFKQGSVWFVEWISEVPSTSTGIEIELEYSTDGDGGPWTSIASGLPNSGVYQWDVPDVENDDCYIRITITDSGTGEASDTNDDPFGIGVAPGGSGDREPHEPIDINSDAGWTPDNGVRSGTGTEADPYIIERWDIWGDDSTCISISNTRRYAIVRDCHLHNTTGLRSGVNIGNVTNITIEDNDIDHTHHGVHVGNSEFLLLDNRIVDIEARGVMVSGEENRMTAIGNHLRNTGVYGFNLDGSGGLWWPGQWKYPALLENNTISGASHGIHLNTASGTFRGNIVKNCYYGVYCRLGKTYDKAVNCTFEDNVITRNQIGMLVSLMHEPLDGGRSWSVIHGNRFERNIVKGLHLSFDGDYTIENNTVAMNPVGIDDIAFGNRTYSNNTIKFNLGGLIFRSIFSMDPDREKVQLVRVLDNDILNNAYYGIRSSYFHYPGEVSGNYYGGVPGEDGDLLDGNVGGGYQTSPNDPETPDIASPVTVVDDGENVSIVTDTSLDTNYFIRWNGTFEIDGADVDLAGHWIAAKIGSYLNTSGGSISNGLTLSVATDNAVIEGTSFDNMAAAVSVYRAASFIGNITVTNENSTFSTSGTIEHVKFVLRRAGIYLNRDRSTILGGTLNTGGWFGIYGMNSEAEVRDTSITGNNWGVGAREGHMTLSGLSISLSSMAGITNFDDVWYYGNMSIDIEGCNLQNNGIGIELAFGQIEGEGTPHDIFIGNNTIDGGNWGLYLEVEDSLVVGNEVTNNGFHLIASGARVLGNTISSGSGLVLNGEAIRLKNNTFDQNARGIHVYDSAPIVVNNDFVQNQYGVYAENKAQPKLKFNNFEDNTEYGVYNDDSDTLVNATLNWWNSATGPGGEGSGDGDDVSDYVAFDPWLPVESDHNGHYENIPPDVPTIIVPTEAGFFFRVDGRTRDPEGDIVRSVEIMLENDTYSTGWIEANGSWRDVLDRGGYAHAFDTFELDGGYDVSVRCYDGNDHSPVATTRVSVDRPDIQDHAPIVIDGNAAFTEENGVRSGSGTEADPYMIERWNVSSMDSIAFSLNNTTSHVVISLCNFHGNDSNDGISITNSRNVIIEDCRFIDNDVAIRVGDDSQLEVGGSLFRGSDGDDIYSRDSLVNITDSAFWSEHYSVNMMGGPEVPSRVGRSLFIVGTLFVVQLNLTFEENVMIGGQLFGGAMTEGPYMFNISSNVFAYGSAGIWFNWGNVSIERNLVVDHPGWGVWGDRSNMTLRENNIFGNRDGVENGDDLTVIDARWNWWGASNGPSGEGSGDGDSVSENVDFDPWLTEPVLFNHDPSISIGEPDGVNDTVDTSFTIEWNSADDDGDVLVVSLFRDTDTDPSSMVLIASELPASDTYEWNVSGLDEGEYYVYGYVEDGNGGAFGNYSIGPMNVDHPATVVLLTPPSENATADLSYEIEWLAENASANATVDLFYDDDRDPDEGSGPIAKDVDAFDGNYTWNVTDHEEGVFYVHIFLKGVEKANATSPGTITIDHPPSLEVVTPPAGGAEADSSFSVEWTSENASEDAIVDLFYDDDTDPSSYLGVIAEDVGPMGIVSWDVSDIEEGDYYILAVLTDGGDEVKDHSDGVLTIDHPAGPSNHAPVIEMLEPDGDNDLANASYTITWAASDEDGDELSIVLRYDDDTDETNGYSDYPIWSGDAADGSHDWDTSGIPDGIYYIHAKVEDDNGSTVTTYSGELTIHHPSSGENTEPTITIDEPSGGIDVSGTVWINGTAHDADGNDDIVSVRIKVGSRSWKTTEGTAKWSFEWDTTREDNGEITIRVETEDHDGAIGTDEISVSVDNFVPGPPWIIIQWPTDDLTVSGTFNITGTAGGDIEIESVTVTVDDDDIAVIGTSDWSAGWDSTIILYENITIVATVEDADGRTNSTSITITVDNRPEIVNEPPTIAIVDGPTVVKESRYAVFVIDVEDPDGLDDIDIVFGDLRDLDGKPGPSR